MKLYFTPLSHFSRKARILIESFEVPCEFIDVVNVAQADPQKFADNPLMAVPVLMDGENWLIESNNIVQYLVQKYDPRDRYQVLANSVADLNIRAVLDGMMSAEVKLIVAKRTGVPVDDFAFFEKANLTIKNCLHWLEERADAFSTTKLSFREIHLVCALRHLERYRLVEADRYPKIFSVAWEWSKDPRFKNSDPMLFTPLTAAR